MVLDISDRCLQKTGWKNLTTRMRKANLEPDIVFDEETKQIHIMLDGIIVTRVVHGITNPDAMSTGEVCACLAIILETGDYGFPNEIKYEFGPGEDSREPLNVIIDTSPDFELPETLVEVPVCDGPSTSHYDW